MAVKLFDQIETVLPQSQIEVTRSYSDMRYELNKLSSLLHPHIIRFIGVFTNPHCFVLEWATLLSLEYQRNEHQKANSSMCYTSILYVLMQVCVGACMYVCMYICVYVCVYVCLCVCIYVCMYICVYMYVVCMYVCMYSGSQTYLVINLGYRLNTTFN